VFGIVFVIGTATRGVGIPVAERERERDAGAIAARPRCSPSASSRVGTTSTASHRNSMDPWVLYVPTLLRGLGRVPVWIVEYIIHV